MKIKVDKNKTKHCSGDTSNIRLIKNQSQNERWKIMYDRIIHDNPVIASKLKYLAPVFVF